MLCVLLLIFSFIHNGFLFQIKPRIYNGKPSIRGQFPFYAFLRVTKRIDPEDKFICGGSLLNQNYILTAAHCIYDATEVEIHLGLLEKNKIEADRQIFHANSKLFRIHDNFQREFFLNDIALVKLPQAATYSDVVKPVKLPDVCELFNFINRNGTKLQAIGNGLNKMNGSFPPILQHTLLTTTLPTECKRTFPFIDECSVFCVKGYYTDGYSSICHGDSGSPIVHPDRQTIYGVASFIHRLGCNGHPQGFTNIFVYLPWISKITGIPFPVCNHNEEKRKKQ